MQKHSPLITHADSINDTSIIKILRKQNNCISILWIKCLNNLEIYSVPSSVIRLRATVLLSRSQNRLINLRKVNWLEECSLYINWRLLFMSNYRLMGFLETSHWTSISKDPNLKTKLYWPSYVLMYLSKGYKCLIKYLHQRCLCGLPFWLHRVYPSSTAISGVKGNGKNSNNQTNITKSNVFNFSVTKHLSKEKKPSITVQFISHPCQSNW